MKHPPKRRLNIFGAQKNPLLTFGAVERLISNARISLGSAKINYGAASSLSINKLRDMAVVTGGIETASRSRSPAQSFLNERQPRNLPGAVVNVS